MAEATEGTLYVIERRVDTKMLAHMDPDAKEFPDGAEVWVKVGEWAAHGAIPAMRRWGEKQGVKFVNGQHRAIPASNITVDDLEAETTTKIKSKR
jgi:hypothetical protein